MHEQTAWRAAAFVWLGVVCAASNAGAQTAVAPAPVPLPSLPASPPPAEAAVDRGEPAVKYTVIEDEGSRIDELRVRGQTQRITVTPKAGGRPIRPYEIISSGGSQDLLEAPNGVRGAAGKRVWHVLSF